MVFISDQLGSRNQISEYRIQNPEYYVDKWVEYASNDGYKGVLLYPIPLLEIFLFFEIWHFLIKSSDFGDWAHQGGFLC